MPDRPNVIIRRIRRGRAVERSLDIQHRGTRSSDLDFAASLVSREPARGGLYRGEVLDVIDLVVHRDCFDGGAVSSEKIRVGIIISAPRLGNDQELAVHTQLETVVPRDSRYRGAAGIGVDGIAPDGNEDVLVSYQRVPPRVLIVVQFAERRDEQRLEMSFE